MPGSDYFSDAAPPAATTPAPDEGSKNAEGKEGESDSQTAVIPLSVLGGKEFKPGETGAIELTLDPSTFSFKSKLALTLTVSVQTEPEHALTNLTIAAAITPSSEPAQHP